VCQSVSYVRCSSVPRSYTCAGLSTSSQFISNVTSIELFVHVSKFGIITVDHIVLCDNKVLPHPCPVICDHVFVSELFFIVILIDCWSVVEKHSLMLLTNKF
jgi:hypothetical protein